MKHETKIKEKSNLAFKKIGKCRGLIGVKICASIPGPYLPLIRVLSTRCGPCRYREERLHV